MIERQGSTLNRIQKAFEDALAVHQALASDPEFFSHIEAVAERVVATLRAGGRILFCGNGGSASDAQHLSAELSGRFYYDRPPLDAEALHVNSSYLTAVANDYGFDSVFARLLQAKGRKGDMLFGLSTSGESKNVVTAFETAKSMHIYTVAMTGIHPGALGTAADQVIAVPATRTPRIQELHILVGHTLCEWVEAEMFPQT